MKPRAFLILCLGAMSGCAGSAPQPADPVPPAGSQHGRVEAGRYHDMRGWFGVATPLAPAEPGYAYLRAGEQYPPNISMVDFTPGLSPGEYYRAFVEDFTASGHTVPGLDQVADTAMKVFGKDVMQARGEPMHLVEQRPWRAGGVDGVLRLYTERTPSEALLADLGMAEDYTAYILMYIGADGGKVAMLWMEWPEDCKPCTPLEPGPATTSLDPIDRALADNGRAGPFMASFHFGND